MRYRRQSTPRTRRWRGTYNGDGVTDLAWAYQWNGGLRAYASLATMPADAGQVASIRQGLGSDIAIDYAQLTEAGVYAKDTGAHACAYPCLDLQVPLPVVVRAQTENGIGGWSATTYAYGGAKVDLEGRGFLGFRWMNAKDEQTGVYTTTEYLQRFPYIGQVEYTRRYVNDGADTHLSTTRNTWSERALSAGRTRFAYVSQSVTDSLRARGRSRTTRALTTVTTTSVYDDYGNPTTMTVTTTGLGSTYTGRPADAFTKTTTNTYVNDTTRWHLGRLLCAGARAGAGPAHADPHLGIRLRRDERAVDEGGGGAAHRRHCRVRERAGERRRHPQPHHHLRPRPVREPHRR